MPEGDTVWRTAARLHLALAGQPLTLWDIRWGTAAMSDHRGAVTTDVTSAGKHLLHRLDSGWTLHTHLRMEGQWRIEKPGPATERMLRQRSVRAAVGTDLWCALGLRLGMVDLVPTTAEPTLIGHLGPDVLGPGWDLPTALDHVLGYDGYLVDALLDQRTLAGVGTFWASESLFVTRLFPWRRPRDHAREDLEHLLATIHRLMDRAKDHAIQSSTGSYRLGEQAYVHGRSGRPCRRCGTTVRVALTGTAPRERTIFSCPRCQGGLAPTDTGRPQAPLGSTRDGTRRKGARGDDTGRDGAGRDRTGRPAHP